jgi:polyisoprenoid-binding protein YceI
MRSVIAALALVAVAAPAAALEFSQVDHAASSIEFSYSQMGVPMDGRFRRFSAALAFDPEKPAGARVQVEVDLASIDTGTPELDTEAAGSQWFDTPAFPTARFVAKNIQANGDGRYAVTGSMSIKGRSRDIVVPTTFTSQGKAAVLTGQFTLRRGDFSIGEGPWAAFDIVANDVQVKFRLVVSAR